MEELAPELGIPCYEKNLELYDVVTANEAFFSGTPFCILPVTRINGQNISDGKIGKITKLLLGKWSDNVGVDIIGQIKKYSEAAKGKKGKGPSPYAFSGGDE
jgi:branched-chain amino acid aminotransferase